MPGRHQHGTTNKNLGINISKMPRDPLLPGHMYMFKAYEGTNRQCKLTQMQCTFEETMALIEQYGTSGLAYEVHWRDRNKYPWFENAV